METDEIKILRQEIADLREENTCLQVQINSIKKMQDFDRTQMLSHIADRLRELHEFIFPTFHKVFPNFAKTARHIDTIMDSRPSHEGDKKG